MYRLSYYPWLTQHATPPEIDHAIQVFADLLCHELAKQGAADPRVTVLPPLDVPAQIEQLVRGDAEIALMNPLGFVFAARRAPTVTAAALALRIIDGQVGNSYYAQLYARKDAGFTGVADAATQSVGYGVPFSTSNFLIPARMLVQAGLHPWLSFRRVEFLQGHDLVARAVYEGKVALGAGHDGVITTLATKPGYEDAEQVLVQLARSAPIPSDPVVLNVADAGERDVLQAALLGVGNSAPGKAALQVFWDNAQGLAPTDNAAYAGLTDALTALKLDAADVLPKP